MKLKKVFLVGITSLFLLTACGDKNVDDKKVSIDKKENKTEETSKEKASESGNTQKNGDGVDVIATAFQKYVYNLEDKDFSIDKLHYLNTDKGFIPLEYPTSYEALKKIKDTDKGKAKIEITEDKSQSSVYSEFGGVFTGKEVGNDKDMEKQMKELLDKLGRPDQMKTLNKMTEQTVVGQTYCVWNDGENGSIYVFVSEIINKDSKDFAFSNGNDYKFSYNSYKMDLEDIFNTPHFVTVEWK